MPRYASSALARRPSSRRRTAPCSTSPAASAHRNCSCLHSRRRRRWRVAFNCQTLEAPHTAPPALALFHDGGANCWAVHYKQGASPNSRSNRRDTLLVACCL